MLKILKTTILLLSLISIASSVGCGSLGVPMTSQKLDKSSKILEVPANKSYIYVIRPRSFLVGASGYMLARLLEKEGKEAIPMDRGALAKGTYILWEVAPGDYLVRSGFSVSIEDYSWLIGEVELKTLPGRAYYITGPSPKVISNDEGREMILSFDRAKSKNLE